METREKSVIKSIKSLDSHHSEQTKYTVSIERAASNYTGSPVNTGRGVGRGNSMDHLWNMLQNI